jgi:hypothetical protein
MSRIPALRTIALAASAALSLFGCPTQGEGDRCNIENGNDDCAEGLLCKSSRELGGNADICCPDGASDNPECIPGGGSSAATTTTSSSTGETTSTTSDTSSNTGGAGQGGSNQGGSNQGGASQGGSNQGGAGQGGSNQGGAGQGGA